MKRGLMLSVVLAATCLLTATVGALLDALRYFGMLPNKN